MRDTPLSRSEQRSFAPLQKSRRNHRSYLNKNALSSVESRVFVDTISSEEANRARAFVIRRGGAPHIKGLGMLVVLLRGVNSLF